MGLFPQLSHYFGHTKIDRNKPQVFSVLVLSFTVWLVKIQTGIDSLYIFDQY